ncbi:hypothetical protein BKA65DRAFT_569027, partial [Rhexocercosporidium sp. MPI-PUGE-AT-0058]
MTSNLESPRKSFMDDASNNSLSHEQNDEILTHGKPTIKHRLFLYLGTAIVVLIILVQAAAIATRLQHQSHPSKVRGIIPNSQISRGNTLHCGHSLKQARALDCVFDIMDYSWIPRPCFHSELSKQSSDATFGLNVTFWNDAVLAHVLPTEEILNGEYEYVFTHRIFHTKHCKYYLHRQTRVLGDGLGTSLLRNSSYGLHCLRGIMEPGDAGEVMLTRFHYERCPLGLGYLEPSERRRPKAELGVLLVAERGILCICRKHQKDREKWKKVSQTLSVGSVETESENATT